MEILPYLLKINGYRKDRKKLPQCYASIQFMKKLLSCSCIERIKITTFFSQSFYFIGHNKGTSYKKKLLFANFTVQTLSKMEIIDGGENDLHLESLVEPAT